MPPGEALAGQEAAGHDTAAQVERGLGIDGRARALGGSEAQALQGEGREGLASALAASSSRVGAKILSVETEQITVVLGWLWFLN
jgi:hypothetical protein